jgi:hypothetical protein
MATLLTFLSSYRGLDGEYREMAAARNALE